MESEAAPAADDGGNDAEDKDGDVAMRVQPITEGTDFCMEDVCHLDAIDAMEVFQFDELYDWEDLERELEVEHSWEDEDDADQHGWHNLTASNKLGLPEAELQEARVDEVGRFAKFKV